MVTFMAENHVRLMDLEIGNNNNTINNHGIIVIITIIIINFFNVGQITLGEYCKIKD